VRGTLELWADNTKMALVGLKMVMRRPAYVAIAVGGFLLFSYAFAMFKDGTTTWNLLWSNIGFGDKMVLAIEVVGRIFRNFLDAWGLILNLLAILQGLSLSLLIFGWRTKVQTRVTAAGLEAGGVGTAVSFLALGCPACGTSLLAPLLTAVAGSGAMVIAESLGWILTVVAAGLLLHAIRRLGYGAFMEITARRHRNAKI